MTVDFDTERLNSVLDGVHSWPVDHASVAVVGSRGVLASSGEGDRRFSLASVTKPLVSVAALLACEEEAISLDEPAGPEGSTVRHLLAHASGVDFSDREVVRCPPGQRRIYSSAGFEILADHIEAATGIAFADYLDQAVCQPLGMSNTVLHGSAGHGAESTLDDMCAFATELIAPVLLAPQTLAEATEAQFPQLDGIVPGYGMHKPCEWGLGMELRGAKYPHWTGCRNSPATFGHFGQSGTFLWVQPESQIALVVLTDRDFGQWAKDVWPELSDKVLNVVTGRARYSDSTGG